MHLAHFVRMVLGFLHYSTKKKKLTRPCQAIFDGYSAKESWGCKARSKRKMICKGKLRMRWKCEIQMGWVQQKVKLL
jgi:hypothetical protein